MSHWSPPSAGADAFLHYFLLTLLLLAAVAFEKVAHHITHTLKHDLKQHKEEREDPDEFRRKLALELWTRAQAELTVLGFLALCIWLGNRLTIFDVLLHLANGDEAAGHGAHGGDGGHHHRLMSAHSDGDDGAALHLALHPAGLHGDGDDGAALHLALHPAASHAAAPTAGLGCLALGAQKWLPPDGAELVHILEDVHMTLFLTMVFYFVVMRLALSLLVKELDAFDDEEKGKEAGHETHGAKDDRRERKAASIRQRLVGFYVRMRATDWTRALARWP
jgi:hypothetical protein